MNNPTDIYAQEQEQEAEAERQRLLELAKQADLMWVMGDKRGRSFISHLLVHTGVLKGSFTQGDPHATAFNEGRRDVGLSLLNQLQAHTPQELLLMLGERILPTKD